MQECVCGASGPHSKPPWERGKEGCLLLTLCPLKPQGSCLTQALYMRASACTRQGGVACLGSPHGYPQSLRVTT